MSERHRFRVVTYNIHKGRGLDTRVRPERIVEVLKEVKADIIALQEVLSMPNGSPEMDQARYFAEALGYSLTVGETRKIRGGIYGNVLLTRMPVVRSENYDISVKYREQRGCLRVDLQLEEHLLLHVFNVHLGTLFYERRTQARKLVHHAILHNPELHGIRVIMGDFNEWRPGYITRLFETHFQKAGTQAETPKTYPAVRPTLMLDHIYFDSALRPEQILVHQTAAALRASDHLPLVVDLELHAPAVL